MFNVFHSGSSSGAFVTASYRGNVYKMNTIAKSDPTMDVNAIVDFVHCESGKPEPATALIIAARHGVMYSVEFLINKGADLNVQIEDGTTALMEAARRGHLRVVVALVEAGADVALKNKDGKTAGELADEEGYSLVARTVRSPGTVTVSDIAMYTRSHLPKQKSMNLRPMGCWGAISKSCLA
jgi:hypothetical protein